MILARPDLETSVAICGIPEAEFAETLQILSDGVQPGQFQELLSGWFGEKYADALMQVLWDKRMIE